MGDSIFINYRRGEDQAAAGRLYDQLEATFTREHIFIDVDNIAPGRDFTEELATRVEQCDVFLAVVGKRWADVVDADGNRRLDNPNDWVRVEIESAQRLGKHIIPVLVDGAEMPRPEKLPEALQPFARRNAARLTHERFRADVQALTVAIARLREAERARAPTPAAGPAEATVARRPRAPAMIGALVALAAIAAAAGVFVWRSTSPAPIVSAVVAPTLPPAAAPTEIATSVATTVVTAGPGASPTPQKGPAPTSAAAAAGAPTAAPVSGPAASPSPDASPSREAARETVDAQPTPSAAPAVAASPAAAAAPPPAPSAPQAVAATTPSTPSATATANPDAPPARQVKADVDAALTPLVAAELRRLGCYAGTATSWDAVDLRLSVAKFAELAKLATLPAEPDVGLLATLKIEPDHFCAPQCSAREVASDGRCVPKTCGANQILTGDGACVARQPKPTAAARAPAPAAGKRCFNFNGSSYCE